MIGALKIAEASALRLLETRVEGRPILSSWDALGDYLQAAMAHSPVEEVRVLFLNAKNMLLANEAMWRGSVDEASVHVREVISRAIALGATAIIIVHNHPSGDPSPSQPGHPPDQGPDRGRPPHARHGPRPCHRRRSSRGAVAAMKALSGLMLIALASPPAVPLARRRPA